MAEDLLPDDVESYTGGRLSADSDETQRALNAALARARRFCGWHVSPVKTETIILDRPSSSSLLILPTLKIVTVNSITVDGNAVDLANVRTSSEAPGVLSTKDGFTPWGGWHFWDSGLGRVSVNVSHGYTAEEAADFRDAVLQLIDISTLAIGTGGSGPLEEKQVDDVTYRWSRIPDRLVDSIARNPMDASILYQYRLLPIV